MPAIKSQLDAVMSAAKAKIESLRTSKRSTVDPLVRNDLTNQIDHLQNEMFLTNMVAASCSQTFERSDSEKFRKLGSAIDQLSLLAM